MLDILKFRTFFLLSNKVLVNRAGIHKMLVRTANGEDPDQTASASDLGMPCLSRPFWKATSVQNFRTFTTVIEFGPLSVIKVCN